LIHCSNEVQVCQRIPFREDLLIEEFMRFSMLPLMLHAPSISPSFVISTVQFMKTLVKQSFIYSPTDALVSCLLPNSAKHIRQ